MQPCLWTEFIFEVLGNEFYESWKALEFGLCKSWKVMENNFYCLYKPCSALCSFFKNRCNQGGAVRKGDAACYPLNRWQCAGTPCTWNSGPACSENTQIHWSRSVAPQQSRSEPSWLQVLGLLQEHSYKSPQQRLVLAWSAIPQHAIDEAIDEWCRRLN